jgi:hypothetical protein
MSLQLLKSAMIAVFLLMCFSSALNCPPVLSCDQITCANKQCFPANLTYICSSKDEKACSGIITASGLSSVNEIEKSFLDIKNAFKKAIDTVESVRNFEPAFKWIGWMKFDSESSDIDLSDSCFDSLFVYYDSLYSIYRGNSPNKECDDKYFPVYFANFAGPEWKVSPLKGLKDSILNVGGTDGKVVFNVLTVKIAYGTK